MHYIHAAIAAIGFAVTMSSCDEHIEFPDTAMKTCDILCTDGEIVRFADIESKGKTPIGVVFHVNQDGKTEGTGYAVYLWDVEPSAFSDSLGVKQNTSANPAAFDGNTNTYAMYASGVSSAATSVFDMWKYGQSAYIPSVAQLQLLYASRNAVNNYISKCGIGVPLRSVARSRRKRGFFLWLQEHYRKPQKLSRIKYDQSLRCTIKL